MALPAEKITGEPPRDNRAGVIIALLEMVEHTPVKQRDFDDEDAFIEEALTKLHDYLGDAPSSGELQTVAAYFEMATCFREAARSRLAFVLRQVSVAAVPAELAQAVIRAELRYRQKVSAKARLAEAIVQLDIPLDRITAAIRGETES